MKTILCAMVSAMVLASCLKSGNRDLGTDYSGEGYLKYEFDGFPYEYTGGAKSVASRSIGIYAKKQLKSASVPATRYTIMGQIGATKQVNITIVTDTLKTGTYTTSTLSNGLTFVKIDSVQYANNRAADFLTVTISKYSAGIIEGTVSGKLSSAKTANGTTSYTDGFIANGVFQNIALQYP